MLASAVRSTARPAAFCFREAMTEHRHQLFEPPVMDAKRPQMFNGAYEVINIRARGARAAAHKVGLASGRKIACILRMPPIHEKAECRHRAPAAIHELHGLHAGAISVGDVLAPVKIGPGILNEMGGHAESHAFAPAAFIEPQYEPWRPRNAAMDRGIDAK